MKMFKLKVLLTNEGGLNLKKLSVRNMTISAMFIALGIVLPFFTGQIPQIGNMLLPMHIPVFLCGLICGWRYGLAVGFILPLLRYVMFGMPVIYPTGIAMAFELGTYGLVSGMMYKGSKWRCILSLYRSIIAAMITGRVVWGIAEIILLGINGNAFTAEMFIAGAFLNAVPGIILQLVVIPAVMLALNKTGLVPFNNVKREGANVNVR